MAIVEICHSPGMIRPLLFGFAGSFRGVSVPNFISVNFCNDSIQVVKAFRRHGAVCVVSAVTMSEHEFDDFLSHDASESYIVSANLDPLFQDIIHLPPAEEKFIGSLVQAEISRLYPSLQDYSFFYEIIGDTLSEGKSFKRIACFIYDNKNLIPIISRFTMRKKRVKYLFCNAFAISRLAENHPEINDDVILGVQNAGSEKTLFILENRKLYFVRNVPALSSGLDEKDILNINMTIDYCFQTLRIKPRRVAILGLDEIPGEASKSAMLPMTVLSPPAIIEGVLPSVLWEYVVPISAFLCLAAPKRGNLLPIEYRRQSLAMDLLRFGSMALLLFCILAGLGVIQKTYNIFGLRETIAIDRNNLVREGHVIEEYNRMNSELASVTNLISAVNSAAADACQQQALVALRCLAVKGVRTTFLTIKKQDDGTRSIEVKGDLTDATYSELQAAFERLLADIKATGKLEITSRKMDPASRTFSLVLGLKA